MFRSDKESYERKKEALVEQFREKQSTRAPFSLKKKTSNLFRDRGKAPSKKLDVKEFNRVLWIDPLQRIAEVEGMITYEALVKETLKYECLPAVVPELKTITVGGALVGLGIESSSFRYGLVHETILELEVLTGTGDVVICRKDNEYRDLFFALPNSYGTLGYVLKIKMELIPAKKFIRLTHLRFSDDRSFFDRMKELCLTRRKMEADSYIDGVIFEKNEMYIILGEFTDEAPFVSNYSYMSAYYPSIREKETDYLTVEDYIWRWDADWFWCSKNFGMNRWLLRLLFGKFMLHSAVYWKISRLFSSSPFLKSLVAFFTKPTESVIQDILVPIERAEEFYDFFQRSIGIQPIWTCPYHPKERGPYPLLSLHSASLYIDFGFWERLPSDKPPGFYNRMIEKRAVELDSYKSLYSDSFYTEEEFWKIHSRSAFQSLKKKYDPEGSFPDLFKKCVREKG